MPVGRESILKRVHRLQAAAVEAASASVEVVVAERVRRGINLQEEECWPLPSFGSVNEIIAPCVCHN